jgi:hypothetical protein
VDIPGRDIIAQLQLALWPLDKLKLHYAAPWKLEQQRCWRRLSYNAILLSSVYFCNSTPNNDAGRLNKGTFTITQHKVDLTLTIVTTAVQILDSPAIDKPQSLEPL